MAKQGKSRAPLIIGIVAALVVLVGLVALLLTQCFNGEPGETSAPSTTTTVETTVPPVLTYDLYWNVDRKDYIATGEDVGLTLREPKEDGYYHVIFAHDGKQIDLPVIDRRTLLKVDSADMMGLIFDANGVVIGVEFVDDLPLEVLGETGWYIQSMGGGGKTIKINSSKSFDGMDETFKTNDETKIYDMSGRSEFVGAPATLQKEDRVYTIANSEGDITHIFIFEREGIKQYKMQYCEYCEKEVQWENWFTGDKLPTTNGHYWLDRDIQMSNTAQIKESNTVCLDLNGHYVAGRSGWRIITTFNAASHLAIFDYSEEKTGKLESFGKGIDQGGCVWIRFGTGHLYGGTYVSSGINDIAGGAVQSAGGTILNIYDGVVIKGGETMNGQGGGALGTNGTVNMYGGIIEGGIADKNIGGTVLVQGSNAVFNMHGGVIRNGQSRGSNGGTVGISGKGTFNMYGGSIYGGRSYQNEKGQNGACGNVYVGANSTLNMYGGSIYGGSCHKYNGEVVQGDSRANIFIVNAFFNMSGGRVAGYVYSIDTDGKKAPQATIRLSGSAQIWGAKEGDPNLSWNAASKVIIGNMWNGAKVGVTAKGVFSDVVKAGTEKYFFSDNPIMEVIHNEEQKLELYFDESKYLVQHCICGDPNGTGTPCAEEGHKIETWRPYLDTDAAPHETGFWYLIQDLTIAGGHGYSPTFSTGTGVIGFQTTDEAGNKIPVTAQKVVLDLNGHSLKGQSGHRLFRLEDTAAHHLIITDTSENKDGKLIPRAGTGNTNHGMAIWMRGGNNRLDVYAGIIDGTEGYVANNNGGVLSTNGTVNFYGGTVIGNGSDAEGSIIKTGPAKVTISGDFTAINNSGRTDAFWVTGGKKLYLNGGNINIDNLYMAAGSRLVIGSLGENTSIGVDANMYGRLTSTDASAFLPYFHAVEEGEAVKLNDDKTLVLVGPNDEGLNEEGAHPTHCACGKTEADCPLENHENIQGEWLPWDGKSGISESGNYYLTQDVTGSTQYWLGSYQNTEDNYLKINLCLHGHSLSSNYRVLGIGTYMEVNLMNCSETESVLTGQCSTKDSGSVLHIHGATSTLNMFDGITLQPANMEDRVIANGGAVNCGGIFNMYGGTIYGSTRVGGLVDTTVYAGNGGAIYVNGNGNFTMYAGEIYGAELHCDSENKYDAASGTFKARGLGGAIMSQGKVTILGGTIYGGKAGDGGAIYAGSGTVTISGGTHYAGVGTFGGGFMKANGANTTVIFDGGVIDGNNPTRPDDTQHAGAAGGGAFMLWDASMTLGGTAEIKNCYTSNTGGAIKVASAKGQLTVSGDPKVTENGKGTKAEHTVDNIHLAATQEIIVKNLGNDAKVSINMAAPGVFTDCEVAEAVVTNANFLSDVDTLEVKMTTSNTLALVAKGTTGDIVDPEPPVPEVILPEPEPDATHSDHCLCNGEGDVEGCEHTALTGWQPLTANTITQSGNYYLTNKFEKTLTIGNGTDPVEVTICLNGQNINVGDWRAFRVTSNATLNLTNCKPSEIGGFVKSAGGNNDHSAVGMVQANGKLNIYDNVTLTKIGQNATTSAGALSVGGAGAEINVYGGKIIGSEVTGNGGTITVSGGATLNVYAGTITGGKSTTTGGNIWTSTGTTNIYGGTISDGQAAGGGNIFLDNEAGVLNIYGGLVTGGVSKGQHGGNISLRNGATVNILGGIVSDGKALPADGADPSNKDAMDKCGGNISVVDTNDNDKEGTLTIGGTAQILGGNGDRGGNVFVHSGLVIIKDEAIVSGGTAANKGWGGGCDCIQINSNAKAHAAVSGKPQISELRLGNNNLLDVTGLTKDANIGISKGNGTAKGVFTAPVAAELVDAFFCERFNVAQNADGALELVDKTFEAVYHCICGKETEQGKHCAACDHDVVAWNPWTDATTAPYLDGYWYLPYDWDLSSANHKYTDSFSTATAIIGYVEGTSGAQVNADVNVYVDLNGVTLKTRSGHRGFRLEPNGDYKRNLTVTDTSASKSGKIVAGTVTNSDQGMIIWSRNNLQKITIWGGTLDASAVTVKDTQGGAAITGNCDVYLYGGKIISGKALSGKGDAIWARNVYLYNDAKIVDGTGTAGAVGLNPGYALIIDSSWNFQTETLSIGTFDADGGLIVKGNISEEQAKIFKINNVPAGYEVKLGSDGISVVAGSTPPVTPPDVPDDPVDPNHKTHCVCGGYDDDCAGHKDITGGWKAWDGKSAITASGNYYLSQDVTESTQYWLGAVDNTTPIVINLCLNGHSIESKYRVFAVGPNTTVNLMNCSDNESVLAGQASNNDNAGVLRIHSATSVLSMYDNIVVKAMAYEGRATSNGGTVAVYGTFNMYGGEIIGGTAGWGGNLVVSGTGSVFNMYDGVIADGTSTLKNDHGGNIYVHNGGFANIQGGIIENGRTAGTGDANGGNIAMSNNGSTRSKLHIGGDAQIISGTANRGGNIFVHTGDVRIDGNAIIANGTAVKGADSTNGGYGAGVLFNNTLSSSYSVVISGSPVIDNLHVHNGGFTVDGLTADAAIGISVNSARVITTNAVDESLVDRFVCGDIRYNLIRNADGKLEMVAKDAVTYCLCGLETELGKTCESCGSEVLTWQPWENTAVAPFLPGNWYLTSSLNLAAGSGYTYTNHGIGTCGTAMVGCTADGTLINEDVVVNVNLNGFTISGRNNNRIYRVEPNGDYKRTLTITDTSDAKIGKIVPLTNATNTNLGMGVWLRNANQTLNIYAGTIDCSDCTVTTSNGAAIASEGKVNLYGGTVIGGVAAKGGAISSNGDIYMGSDAIVVGGTADQGGAIRIKNATLTMADDAAIFGGLGKIGGGGVFLEGSAKLVMSDHASITDNMTLGFGGGVYVGSVDASVTLSGAVKITNNINQSGADDLWLWKVSDPTITIGEGGLAYDSQNAYESALIGIGTQVGFSADAANPTIIAGPANLTANAPACFYANEEGWMFTVNANGLAVLKAGSGLYHCVCGDPTAEITDPSHPCYGGHPVVEWKAWEDTTTVPFIPGNWYLAEDLVLTNTNHTYSAIISNGQPFQTTTGIVGRDIDGNLIEEDVVVNVDLNGKTITGKSNHRVWRVEANGDYKYTLNITDTVGGGKVIPVSAANNQNQGMGVWVRGGSTVNVLNILGGEFIGSNVTLTNSGSSGKFGGMIAVEGANANIFGGIINGTKMQTSHTNAARRCGGTVLSASGAAQVTIYGGTLYGTAASDGGTMFVSGANTVLNIKGGTIYAGTASYGGGAMKIQGSVVVNMTGGVIDGANPNLAAGALNCNNNGGAVFVEGAVFNMSGDAKIINCTAKVKGGAVMLNGAKAQLNMSGNAQITGNSLTNNAVNGGGVHVNTNGAKVTVSGNAKIDGNTNTAGASNLFIGVASAAVTIGEGGLGVNAKIGVSMQIVGAFTSNAAKDYVGNFVADNAETYEIIVGEGDVLELSEK